MLITLINQLVLLQKLGSLDTRPGYAYENNRLSMLSDIMITINTRFKTYCSIESLLYHDSKGSGC